MQSTTQQKKFIFFLLLVLGIAAIAIFAPYIASHDPQQAILIDAVQGPSKEHLFGTDRMGRDLFSRVIYGARTSLSSTLLLVLSIFTIGGTLGMISGFVGGRTDAIIMRISDMMVSFPGMALAIAMAGIMGPSITNAVFAITIVSWTKYARLARSLVLKIKHQDFVQAARLSGTRTHTIITRYMLPSVLPTLIITAASDMGGMMLELAGFSFLGLGAQSTSIEWGYMLNEGRSYMESAPWLMIFPGIAIFITVVVMNLLGDSLRDLLDPHETSKKPKQKRRITMKKFVKATVALLVASFAIGSLAGCSENSSSNGANGSNTSYGASNSDVSHLRFGCYNYSDSLDPVTNVNSSWCGVRYGITECLFKFSSNVVAEPNLCESYTVSDDYITWTLQIRDDILFSNGNPVTPSAVVASIERLYAQTDASKGGKGNSTPDGYLIYDSIVADDEAKTVTIVCSAPTANLPGILAYPYFAIIDTSVADKEIIGTGPYQVDSINTGVSIEMLRNDNYWNGEVPYDRVTILYIEDSSTKSMALQSGDIDLTENITTPSDLIKLSDDANFNVSTAAGVRTGSSYINYNGVLSNKSLRQAILMALDSETMCSVTVGGMYSPGFSILPSSLNYGYETLSNPYTYSPEQAIALLDSSGIVDTNGDGWREIDGKNINLDYVAFSSRNLNEFAEAVALQLSQIGIQATVNIRDYDTATALKNAGQFDLFTANTITVGVGDPQSYLGNWYSANSASNGNYNNPTYDALFEELMIEMNADRRTEIIIDLQQVLIDDAAIIVHGYYNSRMIANANRVSGAEIATIDYYWLTTDIKPVG